MTLHPATLGAAFVLLSAVLGMLLLFAWALNRSVRALAWWGGAFCLVPVGMGFVSLGQVAPGPVVLLGANATVVLAYGFLYAGCRAFNGRAGLTAQSVAGTIVWIAAFPSIASHFGARLALVSVIVGAYALASAWELWRHAPLKLASQRIAIFLLAILALFNFARGALGYLPSSVPWIDAFTDRWSANMALLLVVYVPALAFIFLSMAKEKIEFDYKQAALIDPLTGISNRRAFLKNASELLTRNRNRPASCLIFDLDNFKGLNDRFGHDVGDSVLVLFGKTLAEHLSTGAYGRLGGEEFAAIVPVPIGEATALAETIRSNFAAAGDTLVGVSAEVTVSIGCAAAVNATPRELLQQADAALYQAKARGRNQVVAMRPALAGTRALRVVDKRY